MTPTTHYADRFQARDDVTSYEFTEYAPGSYSSRMWELQRPVLRGILERHAAAVRHPSILATRRRRERGVLHANEGDNRDIEARAKSQSRSSDTKDDI